MAQNICARCLKPLTPKERSVSALICQACEAKLHPKLQTLANSKAAPTPAPKK